MLALSAAFAVVLVAAFVVLIQAISNQRSAGRTALRAEQAIATGRALETAAVNLDNGVRAFVISGRPASLAPFESARRVYPARLAALGRLVSESPQERRILASIDAQIRDYVDLWGLPLIALARDRQQTARSQMSNRTGRDRIDMLRSEFGALFDTERQIAASRQARAEGRSDTAMILGGAGIVLVLAVSLGLWLYLRRSVVRPVTHLADATQAVAGGELGTRVAVQRKDEIGTLGHGFNAMTAELERSNRDLQDFAAVASHDLRGPLITISKLAELLSRKVQDRQEMEIAHHISASTSHLHALVNDLLAYSRVGQGALLARTVLLDDVVRQALDNLSGPIADAGARVTVAPLPTVTGDPGRLCQLVQNLVANAVKFSDGDGAVVEITGERENGHVRLSVADQGVGFPPEQAENIFRPFHRLHPLDRYEGSGIGLAVCARIADQHGGRIWAEGREGEGATFHVELPSADKYNG
jgi:signal transduction histidine kinase